MLRRSLNTMLAGGVWMVALMTAPATASGAAPATEAAQTAAQGSAVEASAPAEQAKPDASARLFRQRCSGCHTVGGGKLTGPDLTAAIQWSEDDLGKMIVKMQEKAGPLTPPENRSLVELLKSGDVRERIASEMERAQREFAAHLEPADAAVGRALIAGRKRLANGGMACLACHRVGARGGSLGPDLSRLAQRMPKTAILTSLQDVNYKVMKAAYAGRPVTAQEALHMAEYLSGLGMDVGAGVGGEGVGAGVEGGAPDETGTSPAGALPTGVLLAGVLLAGVLLAVAALLGLGRLTASRNRGVRRRLLRQAMGG